MAATQQTLDAMREARAHVPRVIRTFLRVRDISQADFGTELGLTQSQVSRRLKAGDFTAGELAAVASYFGVGPATFFKPLNEALSDLMQSVLGQGGADTLWSPAFASSAA